MKGKIIVLIFILLLLPFSVAIAINFKNNSSNYCLDSGGIAINGSKVKAWECVNHPNQSWNILHIDSQFVRFKNKTSGYCLDTDGSAVNGGKVRVWSCTNHPNQLWKIVNFNGNIRIINKASGYCLDTDGRAINDGEVRMWKCENHPNQLWKLQDEPAKLVGSVHTGPGRCDGRPEGSDTQGKIIDSGWISLYSDSMIFQIAHTDCGESDTLSNLPDYGNKSIIHTGPAKCDEWPEGIDWRGHQTSSGWIRLTSRDSSSTAFNAFFVISHDDCGNQRGSCPAGYESKGRIHTGPGDCDGNIEGIDRYGNSIDSGWMDLCVLKKSNTYLTITHNDCISNNSNQSCGGEGEICCSSGKICDTTWLECNSSNHCQACGSAGKSCCGNYNTHNYCDVQSTCIGGSCVACGYKGQPCCGVACLGNWLSCNGGYCW